MRAVLSVAFLVATALAFSLTAAKADTSDLTHTYVSDPNAGWWDRFYIAHPSYHPRSQCEHPSSGVFTSKQSCISGTHYGPGDWALDFYNGDGTPVKFKHYPTGSFAITGKVWEVEPTCTNVDPDAGGWTVMIDIWVGSSWEGYVAYGHLNSVIVGPGQVLAQDQQIGAMKQWPFTSGCYEVRNNDGVHTHIEMYNAVRYSCYWNYASNSYLGYRSILGNVGRMIYTGPQQAC